MKVIAAAFCFVCVCAGTIFLYASTDYGSQFGRSPGKESLQKMKSSPNHDGKRFMNTTETNLDPGFRDLTDLTPPPSDYFTSEVRGS